MLETLAGGETVARSEAAAATPPSQGLWQLFLWRATFGFCEPYRSQETSRNFLAVRLLLPSASHRRYYCEGRELLKRCPGLVVDSCNGGGRRIDFETVQLAYVLWRSDFNDIGEGLTAGPVKRDD